MDFEPTLAQRAMLLDLFEHDAGHREGLLHARVLGSLDWRGLVERYEITDGPRYVAGMVRLSPLGVKFCWHLLYVGS